MNWLCTGLVFAMVGVGAVAYAEDAPAKTEASVTVQDLDREIQFLKNNVEKYNELARIFDRKGDSLQSHDFMGYRNAMSMRDECRGIAKDLESHLAMLEQQRADMLKGQSANPQPQK